MNMAVGEQTSEINYPGENCALSQVLLFSAVKPGGTSGCIKLQYFVDIFSQQSDSENLYLHWRFQVLLQNM